MTGCFETPGAERGSRLSLVARVDRATATYAVGATDLFDRVFYGHQRATADDATGVLALDEALRTARPASHTPSGPGPVTAVPR